MHSIGPLSIHDAAVGGDEREPPVVLEPARGQNAHVIDFNTVE
jgi:hypothetical protein